MSGLPSTRKNGTAASRGGHTLHDSRVPFGGDTTRQDSSAQESNKFPAKHEVSMIKSLNPTDQRTLKLRIRVGSDKTAQKSTALHTSLGLISPSSSMENSPTESGEMLAKVEESHSDSPANILQVGFLLHKNPYFFHTAKKKKKSTVSGAILIFCFPPL